MKRRMISGFLAIAMTMTLFTGMAFASDEDAVPAAETEAAEEAAEVQEGEDFELPPSYEIENPDVVLGDESAMPEEISEEEAEEEEDLELEEGEVLGVTPVTGTMVVEEAKKLLGKPYVHGTQGPNSFDCSGLVWYIFTKKLGYTGMSQSSKDYWSNPTKYGLVIAEKDALPGDLVCWDGHVGIYIGNDQNISALNEKDGVCVSKVSTFRGTNPPHHYIRVKGVVYYENDKTAPVIKDVRVLAKNATGYTIMCTVTDADSGVDRVQFPSWTEKNGLDDIARSWETNTKISGSATGDTYVFRVNVSDHNDELGDYNTNIVAYDRNNNAANYYISGITLSSTLDTPYVSYRTHMQTYAWLPFVTDGYTSGVTGESKRMEAAEIQLLGPDGKKLPEADGNIEYCAHVQTHGWMKWVKNGEQCGTSGESKRMEGIRIKLTGTVANNYDIYYRAHAQHYGWLDWAKNGDCAGTEGFSYRLEALQIVIVAKGDPAPGATKTAFVASDDHEHKWEVTKTVEPDCTNTGYQDRVCYCGATSKKELAAKGHEYEATIKEAATEEKDGTRIMKCKNCPDTFEETYSFLDPHVMYYTHVQHYGDLAWVKDGELSGTTGESLRMESIQVKLVDGTGKAVDPKHLGITYSVHCQTYDWMDWVENGATAGTKGESKRMEAIRLQLTGDYALKYDIYYCVHAQTYGWLAWAKNGSNAGTAGLSKRLEALQIVLVPKGSPAPANKGDETRAFIKG